MLVLAIVARPVQDLPVEGRAELVLVVWTGFWAMVVSGSLVPCLLMHHSVFNHSNSGRWPGNKR